VQTLAVDLLNPLPESEKRSHKLKRLVQSPNSYFMDVKCPGQFASSVRSAILPC
jgi:small subunit ribosomal protein S27e